jgi:UDP-glucose 4-epimerase
MSKVVVFGGSGFIGSHICDLFSLNGYDVYLYDIVSSKYLKDNQTMVVGDVLDQKLIDKTVKGADYVYHFAGIADIKQAYENPVETIKINILSTTYILDSCVKYGVKKFMFASTIYVYSNHGSFYKVSKQASELIIESYGKSFGLKYSIMRYGSLYGKRAPSTNSLQKMITEAIEKGEINRDGDGNEVRDYINVHDAARASYELLYKETDSNYFMITGSQSYKIKEILQMIKEMFNGDIAINFSGSTQEEHYHITPYNFKPNVAKKYTVTTNLDLGQGILESIYDCYEDIKNFD